jgi:hypothetical protein
MMKLHSIYVLKDEGGRVFYVGKTINPTKRFPRHLTHVRSGSTYPVHNKLRKVIRLKGTSDGIYEIIESDISQETVDDREMFFIKDYKEKGFKLKNLTEGGEGGKGYTNEIQKRAALKRVGVKRSVETCKRISEAKIGVKLSEIHKDALKKAWKTRPPMPSDWGEMLSKINTGKINIKKFIVLSPTGEKFITDTGLTDFCRQHGLSNQNLHKTKDGTRKHHKGWKIIGDA